MLYCLCFIRSTPPYDPLCDRECNWEALSRPISHPNTGRSSQPPCSTLCDCGAIVSKKTFKTSEKNIKRNGGRDSQLRPRLRLNSQRNGVTKVPRLSSRLLLEKRACRGVLVCFRTRSIATRERYLQLRGPLSTGLFELPPVDLAHGTAKF